MIITRAPFRISFFGGGTDLPDYYRRHGGAVISSTIDKYLYITCRHMPPYWEFKHRLNYGSNCEFVHSIDEINHPSIRETMRFLEVDYGLDMHYNSDIPARSGIGSSSAFTVCLVHALHGLQGKIVSKRRLATEAINIEQNLIKESVGSQDQIAAAFGGLNHIVFNKNDTFEVNPIIIDRNRIKELNESLALFFTGFQRYSSTIEIEKIKNIKENDGILSEMTNITQKALNILVNNQSLTEWGRLMHENWILKKSLSDKVTTSDIDEIYETGMKNGALGGKILGAGGGGFIMFFVEKNSRQRLRDALAHFTYVPFNFENLGSQVIYYREGE